MKLDDEELSASAGDIIFINAGVVHGGLPQNCIYECIVFDIQRLLMHTDACKYYIRQITRHEIRIQNHYTKEHTELSQAVGRLFSAMKEPLPGKELLSLGSLFDIFGIIFKDHLYSVAEDQTDTNRKMLPLKPVLEYIDANYKNPITLTDLSRISGMSSKYFCRYFHSVIHRTPIDYLNYYRIERACYELSTADVTMAEVAYRCGFHDACYFIKIFKKYKGVTPRQYALRIG